jgi:hypothetical protein
MSVWCMHKGKDDALAGLAAGLGESTPASLPEEGAKRAGAIAASQLVPMLLLWVPIVAVGGVITYAIYDSYQYRLDEPEKYARRYGG